MEVAHLETQIEFRYRLLVEESLEDYSNIPAYCAGEACRLLPDHNADFGRLGNDEVRRHMKAMLDSGGFHLHYQPQYSVAGDLRGVEALLRLPHPVRGFIGPDVFIPLAEENGLIEPLGL